MPQLTPGKHAVISLANPFFFHVTPKNIFWGGRGKSYTTESPEGAAKTCLVANLLWVGVRIKVGDGLGCGDVRTDF